MFIEVKEGTNQQYVVIIWRWLFYQGEHVLFIILYANVCKTKYL